MSGGFLSEPVGPGTTAGHDLGYMIIRESFHKPAIMFFCRYKISTACDYRFHFMYSMPFSVMQSRYFSGISSIA